MGHYRLRRARYITLTAVDQAKNYTKSKVRTKVEHVVGMMQGRLGFTKVPYKGREKNSHDLFLACTLVNLIMAKKILLRQRSQLAQA